jgi:hypothetical protein
MAASAEERTVVSREPRFREFPFDAERFKDLVLYVAAQCRDDPTYDNVKLNTMLYYADFAAYRAFGEPISGATYEKYSAGPAAKQLAEVGRELIACGQAQFVERPHFLGGHRQLIPSAVGAANGENFKPEERELVDSIVEFFAGKSAREVSQFVQREPGWAVADQREAIPYESGWLRPTPPDPDSEAAALRYAREHGYL